MPPTSAADQALIEADVIRRPILAAVALALITAVSPIRAAQQHLPPISCRRLHDEQEKCAFGGCDRRVVERLRRECLHDGGRP